MPKEPTSEPVLTKQTMLVLSLLVSSPEAIAGSKIAVESHLASGSLYPILIRLEKAGWIKSAWEEEGDNAKPRRRLYSITGLGLRRAREEAREWIQLTEHFA